MHMALHTLNQVLEAVGALSSEERAHLRTLLDDAHEEMTEDAFAERMVDIDLLERRRAPFSRAANESSFQPAPVRGKPASAVIIEERR